VLERFGKLLDRHRAIRCLLVMSPRPQHFANDGQFEFPDDVQRIDAHGNTMLEICYPISWGGAWDYPYPAAQSLIRNLRDTFGADKLVWGSDTPNLERFCTDRQRLDCVLRYCDFPSADEMD
jgi:predicted TIM-barrel fold metal-dependent hydrolase